jgi:hypothetical protein
MFCSYLLNSAKKKQPQFSLEQYFGTISKAYSKNDYVYTSEMNFSSAITHKKVLGNNEVPVRFAEMSLNLLLVFILLERLAFTFNLGFPKAFLLGIKYVAVFLMIMAAIQKLSNKNNPSLPFVKGLVSVSFLIGLLSFFQKSEPNLADNLQAMVNWFYVGISIFLSDRFSLRFIRSFIKITTCLLYTSDAADDMD